jgi:triosephosphate isomerase
MPRKPIIAGNWKMHKLIGEAVDLAEEVAAGSCDLDEVEVVVCPPYTALYAVAQKLKGTTVGLAAQDVFWKEQGAYTSQVAPGMLTDVGCRYTIIGHSETRGRFGKPEPELEAVIGYFAESDETVNRKAKAAIAAGLIPIICVGETLDERKAGKTDEVIAKQTRGALAGLTAGQVGALVLAYEPVWAIGTGEVCDSTEANRVCGMIRSVVAELAGRDAADAVRIQYGGSVKPDNSAELLHQPEIDGALVGGASLKSPDFLAIVRSAL